MLARVVIVALVSLLLAVPGTAQTSTQQDGTDPATQANEGQDSKKPPQPPPEKDGDPVVVHTRDFSHSEVDMHIPGRGMDFTFERRYRSQANSIYTELGYGWDHTFDEKVVLRLWPHYLDQGEFPPLPPEGVELETADSPVAGDVWWQQGDWNTVKAYYYAADGEIIEHEYPPYEHKFITPPGKDHVLTPTQFQQVPTESGWYYAALPRAFVVREKNGTVKTFGAGDWGCKTKPWVTYRLTSIRDHAGNTIFLTYKKLYYAPAAPGTDCEPAKFFNVIDVITDTLGRPIQLFYEEQSNHANFGQLKELRDWEGNAVLYHYNTNRHLVRVDGVARPLSPGGAAVRPSTHYILSGDPNSILGMHIAKIVKPNEAAGAGAGGVPYLENFYFTSQGQEFGHVIAQRLGGVNATGLDAGGWWRYASTPSYVATVNHGWMVEKQKAVVVDPNGNVRMRIYDTDGRERVLIEFTGRLKWSSLKSESGGVPQFASDLDVIAWCGSISLSNPDAITVTPNSAHSGQWEAPTAAHDGAPVAYITRTDFDFDDGYLAQQLTAGPVVTERIVYDAGAVDVHQKTNVLIRETFPTGLASPVLRTAFAYEPYFNRVAAVWLPGFFEGKTSHRQEYVHDYQEGTTPPIFGATPDLDQLSAKAVLEALPVAGGGSLVYPSPGLVNNLGDVNGNGVVDHGFGRPVLRRDWQTNFQSPTVSTTLVTDARETRMQYNVYAQLVLEIDPEGRKEESEYHSELVPTQPFGQGTPPPAPPAGWSTYPAGMPTRDGSAEGATGGGLLRMTRVPDAQGATLESESLVYDDLGRWVERTDGRGATWTRDLNPVGDRLEETDPLGYATRRAYDYNGNVVRREREHKAPSRDSNGHPDGEVPLPDEVIELDYDILDRVVEHRRTTGAEAVPGSGVSGVQVAVSKKRYDRNGNLIVSTLPTYDTSANNERIQTRIYDELDRLWKVTYGGTAAEFTSSQAHDLATQGGLVLGNAPAKTTRTRVWTYTTVASDTDGVGAETIYAHDGLGRVTEWTTPVGTTAELQLDEYGRTVHQIVRGANGTLPDATLLERRWLYDEVGRILSEDEYLHTTGPAAGPDGPLTPGDGWITTRNKYDGSGLLVLTVDDYQAETVLAYDAAGRLAVATDAYGNNVERAYDLAGALRYARVEEFGPGGASDVDVREEWLFRDAAGRVSARADHTGRVHRYGWDSLDHLRFMSDARGAVAGSLAALDLEGDHPSLPSLTVNEHGNTTWVDVDQRGLSWRVTRDMRSGGTGAGAVLAGQAIETAATYDVEGRVLARTDPNGGTTSYSYDDMGRLLGETMPDSTAASFSSYDAEGRLLTWQDAAGSGITQAWDDDGRLTGRTISRGTYVLGTTAESFEYDGLGRLLEAADDDSTVTRHWDALGRMLVDGQDGLVASATYDGSNRTMVLSYPGGRTITRSYDAIGRLQSVIEGAVTIASYTWRGASRMHSRTNGVTGIVWGFEYDAAQRVVTSRHRVGTAGAVVDERFSEWDRADNRIEYSDSQTQSQRTFAYDSSDRLVSSQRVRGAVTEVDTYTVDKAGNRTEVDGPLMAGLYEMSGLNALVHQYTKTPADSRAYDPNGNLSASWEVEAIPGSNPPAYANVNVRGYSYDWRNQMVRVEMFSTSERHDYGYDALGRRAKKTVDATGTPTTTRFLYFGDQVIEERDAAGAVVASYVHGAELDEPLTLRRDQGSGVVDLHYLQDDHGNVGALADGSGQVVERYDYTDYGLPLDVTTGQPHAGSVTNNPYRFTGLRFDEETGLYWARSRYYDPENGRFVSRDSIGHWSDLENDGNGLTWCGNNPWSARDPYGLTTIQGGALDAVGYATGIASSFAKGFAKGVGSHLKDAAEGVAALGEFAWDVGKAFATDPGRARELVGTALKDLADGLKELGLDDAFEVLSPTLAALLNPPECFEEKLDKMTDEELAEAFGQIAGEVATSVGLAFAGGVGGAKGAKALRKTLTKALTRITRGMWASKTARAIAKGHAWGKHRDDWHKLGFATPKELEDAIRKIIDSPDGIKGGAGGRAAFWDDDKGMIVIFGDKHPDKGTAFVPKTGKAYFDQWH